MRRTIFFLTVILFSIDTYGQKNEDLTKYQDTVFIKYNREWTDDTLTYTTDTVIFPTGMTRHILTGTTVLPFTHNQQIAKGYGLYFETVTKSDCQKDVTKYGGDIQDKINSIISTDSTLTVDINIYDNCCYNFLCDISVDSSSSLNLIYYGYGTYCDCYCCFGLTFHFIKIKGSGYGNSDIKTVMINSNRKTIKKVKQ